MSRNPGLYITKLLREAESKEDGSECDAQFLSMAGVNLSDDQCVARIERMMQEVQPDLVIIDTLIRVHQGNESSSEDMARISKILQRLCNTYDCALCINHHDRKPGIGGHDSQHAYRGSTEIQANLLIGILDTSRAIHQESLEIWRRLKRTRFDSSEILPGRSLPAGASDISGTNRPSIEINNIFSGAVNFADSGEVTEIAEDLANETIAQLRASGLRI